VLGQRVHSADCFSVARVCLSAEKYLCKPGYTYAKIPNDGPDPPLSLTPTWNRGRVKPASLYPADAPDSKNKVSIMKPSALPKSCAHKPQTEAEVTKECVEFLHSLGWRPKRNHVGLFYTANGVPIPMGERGEPDWTFTHPIHPAIWIELKKTGESPKDVQREFIAKLKHFGYKAGWTDSLNRLKEMLSEWGL